MAFNVIVSRDGRTARLLVQEKDNLRDLEKQTSMRHFSRLREGSTRSIETSTIPSRYHSRFEADQFAARINGLSSP
jgi:Na+/phosphate symporter